MVLSRGWTLKSPVIIKLSYQPEKNSIIPVKYSTDRESEIQRWSIYRYYYKIFFFSDSTQKVGEIRWRLFQSRKAPVLKRLPHLSKQISARFKLNWMILQTRILKNKEIIPSE